MIDRKRLLDDLQRLMGRVETDLLERSQSAEVPEIAERLRAEHDAARQADRTAQGFEDWRADQITQVAAAWVLSVVFVRFLEDNALIDPPRLAGPGPRQRLARDEHALYFQQHPTRTDRDYLLAVLDDLRQRPATGEVFGAHNPIRDLPQWLSGDAAADLLGFVQKIDPATGALIHDFTDPDWDTRFLGDLYQDLSESARKKYALLQTPAFVEAFILDRTLEPAIQTFDLARPGYHTRLQADGRLAEADRFRMIDPACGSGHFLLGSFGRLVEHWRRREPGTETRVLVQRALDSVHGVDLNPFAVAIARFRLLLAVLKACGIGQLRNAPTFDIHIVCGDALLHGSPGGDQETMGWARYDHVYQPEDPVALQKLLRPRHYHAVVANPPYITPKDPSLNAAYRERYSTCHRQYSLAVPFLQRIVLLAVDGGFTGQITANSFMKREFGKKLIESYFPRIDLTHVIDTSGAYIPGHGTPTVILFARNQKPVASRLRTVMGIRGEPTTPDDPARGLVWTAIVGQIDQPGSQSEFVSVLDSNRDLFHKHPWSIGGGGAAELKTILEDNSPYTLAGQIAEIGTMALTREDEVYFVSGGVAKRACIARDQIKPLVEGTEVRDWSVVDPILGIWPYDATSLDPADSEPVHQFLWRWRTQLSDRVAFGLSQVERGLAWFEYSMFFRNRYRSPLSIVFAFVATHNHFVLDRGGKVFKQSAPVIKLPPDATEEDHLALLGLLNSSTACFWMKQVFYPKSTTNRDVDTETGKPEANRYEFAGTGMEALPIPCEPASSVLDVIRRITGQIDRLSIQLADALPDAVVVRWQCQSSGQSLQKLLATGNQEHTTIRQRMIALQEELDWESYRLYRLSVDGAAAQILDDEEAGLSPYGRPYAWENDLPPDSVPAKWRGIYSARRKLLKSGGPLTLIEDPVFKRQWWGRQGVYGSAARDYQGWTSNALKSWLLDRLESYFDHDGRMNDRRIPTTRLPLGLVSVGRLADVARQDPQFHEVGALYRDDEAFDVTRLVTELVESESVPLLPVLRYKPSGLRKRAEWEQTWALQRQEDAIDARTRLDRTDPQFLTDEAAAALKAREVGSIPVPPRYTSADFLKPDFWRLRGKLDVPKERWVSLPHCEGEDGTPLIAWAGLDHLQRAQALSAHHVDIQERLGGRDDPRLVPLLAGVLELLPWLHQWHAEVDPAYGVSMADYFDGFLSEELRALRLTPDDLRAWQPPARKPRGGRPPAAPRGKGKGRKSAADPVASEPDPGPEAPDE